MAGKAIHYEIFLKRNAKASWTLVEAQVDRAASIERAQEIAKANKGASVRVHKETYDERSGEFRPATVFETGGAAFVDDGRADRTADLPCSGPADLVSAPAREAIARAVKPFLTRHKVTTLELLHRSDLVEKLEASGAELQHAVQKIAIAQAQSSDASVQHFVKTLNALVTQTIEGLYTEMKREPFAPLDAGQLRELVCKIAQRPDKERRLRGAIALRLKGAKDWKAKVQQLLDIADEASGLEVGWDFAVKVVGEFVAEALALEEGRAALLVEPQDLGAALDALTDVFRGEGRGSKLVSPVGARLSWWFGEGEFPAARAVIARAILRELTSPKRLRPSDVMAEVTLNRSLADRLIRTASPLIAAEDVAEAFTIRSSRLLENDAIESLLATAPDAGDALTRLVDLADNVVGEQNRRKLGAYIRARLGHHVTENWFVYRDAPVLHRLAELASLRRRADAAPFGQDDRSDIGQRIDLLALQAESREKLFDKIEKREAPPVEKALTFLRLPAKGAVPAGRLADEARARALRLLATPEARRELSEGRARGDVRVGEIAELIGALSAA